MSNDKPRADDNISERLEVRFEYTPVLPEILQHLKSSVLVTTYQANKLLVLGAHQGELKVSFLDYDQAMGLAVSPGRLALGSRRQIHFMVPAHETLAADTSGENCDGCFVPRSSVYTGNIHGHDLAWGSEGLWAVNTRFSCLCTLHDQYSFVPRWRPRFISQLADQDRCHLNGLAMDQGQPKYVTALAETDTPAGWRPTKATSGVVIDVASSETISRGYAMPHSPRLANGRLWVLNSGCGTVGHVDRDSGRYEAVESVPGYTRGLALAGQFAFVGLSKIRETSVFGGLPIAERKHELRCGLAVIDLISGRTVAVFQFHTGVSEIFAVEVLSGTVHPKLAGASLDQNDRDVWIVPAPNQPRPAIHPAWPLFAFEPPPATGANATAQPPAQWNPGQLINQAEDRRRAGNLPAAEKLYRQALAADPRSAAAWVNFGNLQQEQNDQAGAIDSYRQALHADASFVPARQNLGYLLFNRGLPDEADAEYERLLKLAPTPLNRLLAASVLPVVYESKAHIDLWRGRQLERLRTMAAEGDQVDAAKQLLPTTFFWAYQGCHDPDVMRLRGQIVRGVNMHEDRPAARPRGDSRIRVGFVSAYFRDHTIGRLNIGRVEQLDRERFHVTVATNRHPADSLSERFRQAADQFVPLPRDVAQSRQALAAADLDVLIFADVGMDALTSTLAFSRMAPIQAATWGHPETTGSPHIDYFLSGTLLDPQDAREQYTETLVRLPELGTYYERPETPAIRPRSFWGLDAASHLYLCPQTLFKFHPRFDATLARILNDDPQAVLAVIAGRVPEWTRRLQERWRETIPGAERRIRFLPAQPRCDFLSLLKAADVVLDTHPFCGGNTSYEAFAVGKPVVTCAGEALRGRITAALYHKMDLAELIAGSESAVSALALRLTAFPRWSGNFS